jgi:hypothetical protein
MKRPSNQDMLGIWTCPEESARYTKPSMRAKIQSNRFASLQACAYPRCCICTIPALGGTEGPSV